MVEARTRRLGHLRAFGFAIASTALVGVALVGCGGGSAGEDFVVEANSICSEFEEFSSGQEERFQDQVAKGDFEQAAATFEDYGRELKTSVNEISGLERPTTDRAAIDTFVQTSRELTELVPGVVSALREADTATLLSVATRLRELQTKADRAARQAGLDQCADTGPTGT